MNTLMTDHLLSLRLGECLQHRNLAVFPLTLEGVHGPSYLTLKEALARGCLSITEVSEGGSVPMLAVSNQADLPVLILDGEEVQGAKQNRVINTTVLVAAHSKVTIPVSCTEQGRWSYSSAEFSDSDVVLSSRARSLKSAAVSSSLRSEAGYAGDQGQVWDEVACLCRATKTSSPTSAMRHVYEEQKGELDDYLAAFPLQSGQFGLLVLIDGEVVGFDIVSQPESYAQLHGKLVRSFALDALVRARRRPLAPVADPDPLAELAGAFLAEAQQCREESFAAVGLGTEYRYTGSRIVGSALQHEDVVVHTAFFRVQQAAGEEGFMREARARMLSRLEAGRSA